MTDRHGKIEYNNYEINNMTNPEFESFINLKYVTLNDNLSSLSLILQNNWC